MSIERLVLFFPDFDSYGVTPGGNSFLRKGDVIYIGLTQDRYTVIDADCIDTVQGFRWHANKSADVFYAKAVVREPTIVSIKMHQLILPDCKIVDHINRDGLDNRKSNLRAATCFLNSLNRRKQKNNTSGYPGVGLHQGRWCAKVGAGGKTKWLGSYSSLEEAAAVVDKYRMEMMQIQVKEAEEQEQKLATSPRCSACPEWLTIITQRDAEKRLRLASEAALAVERENFEKSVNAQDEVLTAKYNEQLRRAEGYRLDAETFNEMYNEINTHIGGQLAAAVARAERAEERVEELEESDDRAMLDQICARGVTLRDQVAQLILAVKHCPGEDEEDADGMCACAHAIADALAAKDIERDAAVARAERAEAELARCVTLNLVDEIPQDVIASGVAAYRPSDRQIWIRKTKELPPMIADLLHEFGHHAIMLRGGGDAEQRMWDEFSAQKRKDSK
jgi:hypothetical protein